MGSLRGADEVKQHPWCSRINWSMFAKRQTTPPYRPKKTCSNFDPEYTSLPIDQAGFSDTTICRDAMYEKFDVDGCGSETPRFKEFERPIPAASQSMLDGELIPIKLGNRASVFQSSSIAWGLKP
jgi:hypothetical protein